MPGPVLRFDDVKRMLPQGRPFLMIDEVLELDRGRRILCSRNVTGNETVFEGHFPGFAIMPGVLLIEAMAQASILLYRLSRPEDPAAGGDTVFLLVGIKTRMKSPAAPGDRLLIAVESEKMVGTGAIMQARVKVGEREVAEAQLTFAARPIEELRKALSGGQAEAGEA